MIPIDITNALDSFKAAPTDPNYPPMIRTLYSPVDDVHGALLWLLSNATNIRVAMYAFDDNELADLLKTKITDPKIFVQVTLDESQSVYAVLEAGILKRENYPNTSIAIGCSEKNAIVHLKMLVVDDLITVTGSTNWSPSAELDQDNALVVIVDPVVAAESAARLDAIHAHILAGPRTPTSWWRRALHFIGVKSRTRSAHWLRTRNG